MGILVDSVSEVLKIPISDISPAPEMLISGNNSECVKGVGKLENRLLLLIDSRKIVRKEEQLSIIKSGYQGMIPE